MLRVKAVTPIVRDLVERAQHGDLDAFSQLVKVSAPRLKGVATLILRDATRAEDALQDALLLAWRDVRGLRDPDAWDAWLRRLTVRACYKVAKKERRRHQVELNVTPDPASAHTPDTSADVAEREWVLSELDRLDIDRRAVIVLHYYLDLPLPEVANILGIPYGTAASRLHRGLDAMRTSMRISPGAEQRKATERSS
jgi:RNA polymerase sigma factor (sigma-70 family)